MYVDSSTCRRCLRQYGRNIVNTVRNIVVFGTLIGGILAFVRNRGRNIVTIVRNMVRNLVKIVRNNVRNNVRNTIRGRFLKCGFLVA